MVPSSRAWAHGNGSRMRWLANRLSRAATVSNSDPSAEPEGSGRAAMAVMVGPDIVCPARQVERVAAPVTGRIER